jgi:hypothetical protein
MLTLWILFIYSFFSFKQIAKFSHLTVMAETSVIIKWGKKGSFMKAYSLNTE